MRKSVKTYCDGTHRIVPPSVTIEKAKQNFVSFGITRVADITGLDNIGIPVVLVSRPNSRSLAVSQGKGITHQAATASAIMESIEGFHAERIFKPTCLLSYEDLLLDQNVINVQNLPRLKSSLFHEKMRIPWVQGINLFSHENVWIPFECVHTDYTEPWPHDHGNFISDSNGLASGNSMVEAINHGLYEVIERDALALWSLTKKEEKAKKKLKLTSLKSPLVQDMIRKIKSSNIGISVWDITSDISVPTFICKILPHKEPKEIRTRPAYGSGSHICEEIALLRAITEAAQSRLTFISGARDDQYQSIYKTQISEEIYQKWHDEIFLDREVLSFENYDTPDNDCLEKDQAFILATLKRNGVHEVVCVDLTRPQFDIPVVKIIVPELEGISFPGKRILGKRGHLAYSRSGVGACIQKS